MDYKRYEKVVNEAFSDQILEFKLTERQKYLELFSIAIQPAHRGQGLGSAIIEDVIEYAKESGYKGIQLQVDHKTKHKLVPFYETFGFKSIDDELMDFMRIDFEREDDYVYE